MSIGKMPKYVNNDQRSVHALANAHFIRLLGLCAKTDSQLRQDLFVLSETGFKRRGYFVEFGATNGVDDEPQIADSYPRLRPIRDRVRAATSQRDHP